MMLPCEKKLILKTRHQEEIPWFMQDCPFYEVVEDVTYFCDEDGVPYWDETQYFVHLVV